MQRVLITGGTGFVGTYLVQYLRLTTPDVIVMASNESASQGGEYYQVDIRRQDDVRCVIRESRPTEIYHLAGVSAVDASWTNPRLTFEVNVVGTYNLFAAAMDLVPAPRILNISTAQVYARSDGPLTEESPVSPDNPYAASKAMAELLAVSFRRARAGGIMTARSFNHTGPGQLPTFVLPSIAKQFAEMEIGLIPPRLTVGNIDVTRDFTDVRDVIRAYTTMLREGKTGEVYNVCSGIGDRLSDIIKQFQAVCRTVVSIDIDSARLRPGETRQVVGDSAKIRRETRWSPQIPMDRTIRDLMDYWRDKISTSAL